jgi:hypothetical protein
MCSIKSSSTTSFRQRPKEVKLELFSNSSYIIVMMLWYSKNNKSITMTHTHTLRKISLTDIEFTIIHLEPHRDTHRETKKHTYTHSQTHAHTRAYTLIHTFLISCSTMTACSYSVYSENRFVKLLDFLILNSTASKRLSQLEL